MRIFPVPTDPSIRAVSARSRTVTSATKGLPPSKAELEKFLADWKEIRFPTAPAVPPSPTSHAVLAARFSLRQGEAPRLAISETDTIEGKESFNWGSKHDYCKTLAGMANNKGGYILLGVKDGSFEIVCIADDRMDRFDLKKANEYITRSFNQAFVLDKGQFTIGGKTIGVLHVSVSANKPVVCTLDGNTLFSGDIFYRYPGETRRIQAPELEALLKQRDSSAESRLLHLVAKLAESGAHNAAVINLVSGEATGERGQFLIEESLLDKIKFITEGRLEERTVRRRYASSEMSNPSALLASPSSNPSWARSANDIFRTPFSISPATMIRASIFRPRRISSPYGCRSTISPARRSSILPV